VTTAAAPTPPPVYPEDLERTWIAPDGTAVLLRALRPDDLDRELRFIAGLSSRTLYQRVQYSSSAVSRSDAARLLDLDYRDRMAIGALTGPGSDPLIVGVSRYARDPGQDTAECAIVVTDDWQGRGLGTQLMRSLAVAARRQGIRWLVGSSLADNSRIHDWARRFGLEVRTQPDSGGQVVITVDLQSIPA
jgi:acetyltransferase